MDYQKMLADIARDKGMIELAEYIDGFKKKEQVLNGGIIYNVTKMPEATCDGCQ